MKLQRLIEDTDEQILDWFKGCSIDAITKFRQEDWSVKDGVASCKSTVALWCKEIKYPMGKIGESLTIMSRPGIYLNSLRNFPKEVGGDILLGAMHISKIDTTLDCRDGRLNLAMNNITSLKDIHKFVKCKILTIYNNPIKDSILGILLIPGITKLSTVEPRADAGNIAEFKVPNRALSIVAKYVGQGKAGVLAAQKELEDNDLDDYAQL